MTIWDFLDRHFDGCFILATFIICIGLGGLVLRYLDGPHMVNEVDDGE